MDNNNKINKYIFLDIDGVLNSYEVCELNKEKFGISNGFGGWFREEDIPTLENVLWGEDLVQNLKFIVDATNAKIVISSTWRNHFSVEKFKEMFALYGYNHCPIIGLTENSGTRGKEIQDYLDYLIVKDSDVNINYVILDDNDQFLAHQKDNFVHTSMMVGLTRQDAMKAIKILNS